jgi:hypothetical protein
MMRLVLVVAVLSACGKPAARPSAGGPLSPRRDDCTTDDDCALYNTVNEHAGEPGGPAACCMESKMPTGAARRDWVEELDRVCAALPPGPCPGGNEPPSRVTCRAGRCEPR